MKRIELNGTWSVKAKDAYSRLPNSHQRVLEWFPAEVPGTIHTDLLAQQLIPDPYYRMNENDVQWVENIQWLYRRDFHVTAADLNEQRIVLVAEGLDTYAAIMINGKNTASTENMFIEHRHDVKKYLKEGNNTIEILLDSPVFRSKQLEKKHGSLRVALEPNRVYVRKAQYSFSWDWGPKLTTSGIWKSIFLEISSGPMLKNLFVKTLEAKKTSAVLEVSVEFENFSSPVNVTTTIKGPFSSEEFTKRVSSSPFRFKIKLNDPVLWWPNGYGAQPIYTAVCSMAKSDGTVSETSVSFGIRTIELLQEKDSQGRSFTITVNGEKIFCKGADWIPCDNFIPRIPDSRYEQLLTMACDAHMNMIRVWGGGIYENEIFYNLCDRLGLLVWQDFMFACGEYPENPWFLDLVKDEAEKVVIRLRNHPSIAVWCGNNECEWLFCTENPNKTPDDMTGAVIFRDLLPRTVKKLDGSRPFWRSSPFGAGFPNSESNGTHHHWEVWSFWKDFQEYEKDNARFVSEFGFQAPANIRTWHEITLPEERTPQHLTIEHHNKQVEGQERLFRFQAAHYTVGKNFDDFVYRGQLVQANALKTAVEHWRRRKFNTSGTLFWQLNDCWPVSSWAVIDSSLRPKAAYFYTKRFFAQTLVSFKPNGDNLEVWGTHDSLNRFDGLLQIKILSFKGEIHAELEYEVLLRPNSSAIINKLPSASYGSYQKNETYIVAYLLSDGYVVAENRKYFLEPKHLNLPSANINCKVIENTDNSFQLNIQTDLFAKDVRIEIDGIDAVFNDNYFDLDPGALKIVQCIVPERVQNIKSKIRMVSLQNT